MTPQEMDRLLAEELTAEPSPDFAARVRAQVAAEPAPAPWHRWWPAAVAGVAAVAFFVASPLPTHDEAARQSAGVSVVASGERPATGAAQAPEATRVEPVGAIGGGARVAEPGVAERGAERGTAGLRSSPPAFPEVLISPDDAGAVALLLSSGRDGISPPAADDTSQPLMVTQIDLPPIQVAPLAELTQLEPGERQ